MTTQRHPNAPRYADRRGHFMMTDAEVDALFPDVDPDHHAQAARDHARDHDIEVELVSAGTCSLCDDPDCGAVRYCGPSL